MDLPHFILAAMVALFHGSACMAYAIANKKRAMLIVRIVSYDMRIILLRSLREVNIARLSR